MVPPLIFSRLAARISLFAILLAAAIASSASAVSNARIVGKNLIVTGDRYDNYIDVVVLDEFGIVVVAADETFIAAYNAELVNKVIIRTYGGDDEVFVSRPALFPTLPTINFVEDEYEKIALEILTCSGDDDVEISGEWGATRVVTSGGEDDVIIGSNGFGPPPPPPPPIPSVPGMSPAVEELDFFPIPYGRTEIDGDLYISTGGNDDYVDICNTDVFGTTRVLTGAGDDDVEICGPRDGNTFALFDDDFGVFFDDDFTLLMAGGDDSAYIAAQFGKLSVVKALDEEPPVSDVRVYLNGGGGREDCLELRSFVPDPIILAFEDCVEDLDDE